MILSQFSGEFCRNGSMRSMPAMLAMMSKAPLERALTWSANESIEAASSRLSGMNSPRPPADLMSCNVALPVSSLTSPRYTVTPAAANCRAVARPIPEPQPVTTATLPVRSVACFQLSSTASVMFDSLSSVLVQEGTDQFLSMRRVEQRAAGFALETKAVQCRPAECIDALFGHALGMLRQRRYPIRYGARLFLDARARDRPFDHAERGGRAAIDRLAAQDDASRNTPAAKTCQP